MKQPTVDRTPPELDTVRSLNTAVDLTVHIVCANWHKPLVDETVKGAIDFICQMSSANGQQTEDPASFAFVDRSNPEQPVTVSIPVRIVKHRVSGTWEIMARISSLVHQRSLDMNHVCYVACGTVIRGETSHYDHLCDSVFSGLSRLITRKDAVIGAGLLTCDTVEQAEARAFDKGYDSMESAFVEMWRRIGGRAKYS